MMPTIVLLLLAGTPSENWERLQKEIDKIVARRVEEAQDYIADIKSKLKTANKKDAASLKEKLTFGEDALKGRLNPANRPKMLYLNESKLKAGQLVAFGDDDENDKLRVRVVQIIDKTTFIARKPPDADMLYYVEDYPTKKLEEGETTLMRGMYEVTGLDTAPGPPMWHIKPFPLPERAKK